jgi:hypothetical protein
LDKELDERTNLYKEALESEEMDIISDKSDDLQNESGVYEQVQFINYSKRNIYQQYFLGKYRFGTIK